MEKNKWHLLSPENYNKVFDVLSQKYPKFFTRGKVFIFKKEYIGIFLMMKN